MKTKLMAMLLAAGAALGAYATNVRVYVNVVPEAGWNPDRYFYAWAGTAQNFGAWPGIKVENAEVLNGETWHYMDIDATDDEFYLIFNDGESHCQTINVLIAPVKEGKRFFVRVSSEGETNAFSGYTTNYANIEYERVQLWEGGPYWATMNIGAEKPEDYGYYFWWGDTTGYRPSGTTFDFRFYYDNTVISTCGKSDSQLKSEGWLTDDGVLAPEHDAAHVLWGGKWRMPTFQELLDLIDNCDWSPTTMNGVDGFEVRGRGGYASASIFLPFAGYGAETSVYNSGSRGYYWSSSSIPESSNSSWGLFFESGSGTSDDDRYFGQSVRPVYEEPVATVSVTFDENFEGGAKTETNFLASATILANAPDVSARDGWTFAGWFDAAEGGNQILATDLPTDGATYYAHWTPGPDQIAAGAAAALIAAIGDVAYTDESKAKIDAARAAYNALTTTQRALVTNYATLTAAEAAYAALVPAPCYEVIDAKDITAPYAAPKAVTLLGAAYDGCDVVGIVELKLGKVNAKKKTSKVSGSVTTLDGKKHTIKGVTVTGIDGTAPAVVSLAVKDLGTLSVTIGGAQFAGTLGGAYHVQSASVGGTWAGSTATATVEINDGDFDKFPGTLLTSLLPDGETATVDKKGKWAFAKAATVKWAKAKGAAEKSLIVDTSKGKTNLSGLKFTYTPKKGTFKGSFKGYALDGSGKTVKLNKYTFNVSGFVFDGVGYGKATCKKPSVSWSVTVE